MTKYNKMYFKMNRGSALKNLEKIKHIYYPRILKSSSIKKGQKVLEVGCAFGDLLSLLDDLGCETFGVDMSKYALDQAKTITKAKLSLHDINKGLEIYKDSSFDVVIAFDVIEHLESPFKFLKECNRILKKGCFLIITTPNMNSLGRGIFQKRWFGYRDSTHIYLFYPESLKHLVKVSGFKVRSIECPFHRFPKIIQMVANKTKLGGEIWIVIKKK